MSKLGFAATKTVSKLRKFKNISDEKMKLLKVSRLERRTHAKVQWAVRAYREWRNDRLSDPLSYDYRIYEADIDQLDRLEK